MNTNNATKHTELTTLDMTKHIISNITHKTLLIHALRFLSDIASVVNIPRKCLSFRVANHNVKPTII